MYWLYIYGLTPLPPTSLHQNTMANHNIDHHLRDTDLFIYWQWVGWWFVVGWLLIGCLAGWGWLAEASWPVGWLGLVGWLVG